MIKENVAVDVAKGEILKCSQEMKDNIISLCSTVTSYGDIHFRW